MCMAREIVFDFKIINFGTRSEKGSPSLVYVAYFESVEIFENGSDRWGSYVVVFGVYSFLRVTFHASLLPTGHDSPSPKWPGKSSFR